MSKRQNPSEDQDVWKLMERRSFLGTAIGLGMLGVVATTSCTGADGRPMGENTTGTGNSTGSGNSEQRLGRAIGATTVGALLPGGWSGRDDLAYLQRCLREHGTPESVDLGGQIATLDPARRVVVVAEVPRGELPRLVVRDRLLQPWRQPLPPGARPRPLARKEMVCGVWVIELDELPDQVAFRLRDEHTFHRGRWEPTAPTVWDIASQAVTAPEPLVEPSHEEVRSRGVEGVASPAAGEHLFLRVSLDSYQLQPQWMGPVLSLQPQDSSSGYPTTLVLALPRHRLPPTFEVRDPRGTVLRFQDGRRVG